MEIKIHAKSFSTGGLSSEQPVLENIDLQLRPGEFVVLFGPSGCGKTTLLNIIAGLDAFYEGDVRLPSAEGRVDPVTGYVFQTPRLLPWRTVRENIQLVLDGDENDLEMADALIEDMRLAEFANSYPNRLSVGMRRRVALARAFIVAPDLLLMDEPFISLDDPTARRLRMLLLDVWKRRRTTVLFVTHDLREAVMLADRIVFLSTRPATVIADIAVDIPRDERHDDSRIEDFRSMLIMKNGFLFADP